MNNISLEIISPEKQILKEENIEYVKLLALDGPITILNKHASLLTALDIGILIYKKNNKKKYISLGEGGFADINNNHISIIINTAEKKELIDINRAKNAEKKAKELLLKGIKIMDNGVDLKIYLKKALNRIACVEKTN